MSVPLTASAFSGIARAMTSHGLNLLGGVFCNAQGGGVEEITRLIEERTRININDLAGDNFPDEQWEKLREFESQYQAVLLESLQRSNERPPDAEKPPQSVEAVGRGIQDAPVPVDGEDKFIKRFIYYYAFLITLLTFLFIFYAAFFYYDNNNKEEAGQIINTVTGFLLGVSLSAIIQFFFGSSQGSKSKDSKIKELSKSIQDMQGRDQG